MKKLLPTLIPLFSTAVIALVPQLQAFLVSFVSAHPAWTSFVTAAGLILNHWLPSPGTAPSDSTIAKIGTSALLCITIGAMLILSGCSALERQAYNVIVASKAFTLSISAKHPECGTRDANGLWVSAHNSAGVCSAIDKGISAKDLLIDAAETYCAGTDFEAGGPCNAPTDKTIKSQLAAKVAAAISNYEQTETDLRGLIK